MKRIDILENLNKLEGVACFIEVKEVKRRKEIVIHTPQGSILGEYKG